MDRREELKAKARDYERNDQPEHALEIYMGMVKDAPPSGLGGLWGRIGDLQEQIGGIPNALESLSRSAMAFSEVGQVNNAIAVTQRILRLAPDDASAHLRLGELSLGQGFRGYARSGIGAYARQMTASGTPEAAVASVAAFLARFPDDTGIWQEWEEELIAGGHADRALPLLNRIRDVLVEGEHSEAIDRIAKEWDRLRGNGGGPNREATAFASDDVDEVGPQAPLPILGSDGSSVGDDDDSAAVVAPIEGLESTGADSYAFEPEGPDEALPLLGNLPELGDAGPSDEEREDVAGPLSGVEHFGFSGDGAPGLSADSLDETEPVAGTRESAEDPWNQDWSPTGDPSTFADDDEEDTVGDELPLLDAGPQAPRSVTAADGEAGFDPAPIVAALHEYAGVEVDVSDAESHYDLGVAYKEMERFDESVANLAMAMQGGHDPAAILEIVGEILVRRGEYSLADDLLRRLPGMGDRLAPEHLGVSYWLARAAEESGRREHARRELELVVSVDPEFRDAADRLRNLV